MDRDDHISKLFRAKADDYEVKPSKDLWSRIESNLDVVDTPTHLRGRAAKHGRMVSMSRWFVAAASVAVIAIASIGIINLSEETQSDLAEVQRIEEALQPIQTTGRSLEGLPIAALTEKEQEANFAAEDAQQANRILNAAKQEEEEAKKLEEITLVDRAETTELIDDFIFVELEEERAPTANTTTAIKPANVSPAPPPPSPQGNTVADDPTYTPSDDITPEANLAINSPQFRYEDGVTTNTNIMNYSDNLNSYTYSDDFAMNSSGGGVSLDLSGDLYAVEEAGDSYDETYITDENRDAISGYYGSNSIQRRAGRERTKRSKDKNELRLKGSMEIFDWLIGSWSDDNQQSGTSIEEWKISDANTLSGKGYVILDDSKIFQENMEIAYKKSLRQIFLTLSLDDSGNTIQYMLTGYDIASGEYVFQQAEDFSYPDKVLFQRDLSGKSYSVIIVDGDNKRNSLDTEQQRYLDHRNHVSGARATRKLNRQ